MDTYQKKSATLIPTDPSSVMVIRTITPLLSTLSVPFARYGRFKVGGRATIVKLKTSSLAVFSPVSLTPDVQSHLTALGNQVRYLICPDAEHHIFLTQWAKEYPQAHIIGPEALVTKRAADPSTSAEKFSTVFNKTNKKEIKVTEEFDAEFEYEYIDAHPNKELVFFHKPSKTLIEADLMFNLPATEQYSKTGESASTGLATKFFVALMGTSGDAKWQKRFLWSLASKGDRNEFNEAAQRIDGWDFDKIVPCHGDVIEQDAKGIFRKVFEWHLNGKK
ncbi:MAG: hypothetical protein M1834_006573 [Cirrosporium novae-zelandiae]|nr:MAG: hypothetical protein M1834_006573 [Cirrosporium novae-zelandiae]